MLSLTIVNSFILWIYYKKIAISFRLSIHFVFLLIFLMICKLLDLVICFGACLSCLLGFAIAMVDSNLWPSLAFYYLLKPPAWLVGILSAYCCFWKYFVPSFEERQFLCYALHKFWKYFLFTGFRCAQIFNSLYHVGSSLSSFNRN